MRDCAKPIMGIYYAPEVDLEVYVLRIRAGFE